MDNGDGKSPASDQSQKKLSVSLAASSMINASDMISSEAYEANLKRIQEVKEMVRTLEMNNEVAHKNFLVDQLEKRAKDGREAEDMLTQLRNQPAHSESVRVANNAPSDKSEVILPTTATLVEVPDPHSSYTSPSPTTTSHPPRVIQQGRPAQYQRSLPPPVQPYYPDVFRHYTPVVRQPPQYSAAPHPQALVDQGQTGWYTTQNAPPQSVYNPIAHQTGFQPIQPQQPSRTRSSYPHQVIALPAADLVHPVPLAAPGYYATPAGWLRTAPAHGGPITGSSSSASREPGLPTQSTASRPLVNTHGQSQNPSLLTSNSQVQVPFQGVSAGLAKIPSNQPPPIRSHPNPVEFQFQSRPVSAAVPKTIAISELQRPHKLPQELQQHQQQSQQLQPQPQPSIQPTQQSQQRSQQPQPQPQRRPQPPLHPQRYPQPYPAPPPSQPPIQPPQMHPQVPLQLADRAPSTGISQSHTQPSQPPPPTIVREQARQRGSRSRMDQPTFINLFQNAIQRGILHLKAFWLHAKASGVSDEWFKAAINSLPRDVWQSVMAQANQSEPMLSVPPLANAPQQQMSAIHSPDVLVVSAPPPPIAAPQSGTTPIAQTIKPSTSTEGRASHPVPGQISGSYATELQYYAEQATNSALPAQVVATPTQDVSQVQASMRTPKDANKSTLARDILRSFGKTVPKPCQEVGGKVMHKADHDESDQLPEVAPSQLVSGVPSPQPPIVPPPISSVDANSASIPSTKPIVQDKPQRVDSQSPSTANSVPREEYSQAAVIEGPIMIDLTLEDSDDFVDGKGRELSFPIRTSASAATSSRPISSTNTTNHTPLLENLSLEEPPVDTATDGDNADVRMYSPPLSLAAEENIQSELLYTPPGGTELASSSFEPLPHEASEHPLDGQLPLFLPSPPISPAHTEPPETDLEIINDDGESRPSLKRHSVDVDEMEIDTEPATPPRVRKRRKQQVYVHIPPAPLYVKKAIKSMKERAMGEGRISDLDGAGEDEEIQYSHLEQLLVEESKSRLLERRCRWLNCSAVLNCAANLLAHLKEHAREEDSQAPFLCRWTTCQRRFGTEQERNAHLERHTIRPLPCPFTGCDEQFDKPVEVMQHEVQHQKTDRREPLIRKPTCQPIIPAIPARLGPPPQRLPSHRVIPRRVVKCRISADRHATVGPWVLWNIFSPVDLNMRKQNASMRGRPARQSTNHDVDNSDPRHDDYDFLLALSSYPAKNPQLDDLDSTVITMSAARGLTLWGSGSAVNSAAESATPEEYANAVSVTEAVNAAVPSSATEGTAVEGKPDAEAASIPEERESGRSMATGEEDAVERMLVL